MRLNFRHASIVRTFSTGLFLTTVCCCSASLAQTQGNLRTSDYRGGLHYPRSDVYIRLHLSTDSGRINGTLDAPFDKRPLDTLRSIRVDHERLSFNVGVGETLLRFDLHQTQDGYSGSAVRSSGQRVAVGFTRIVPVQPALFATYQATYQIARNRSLSVVQVDGSHQLWYCEYPSGRLGALWPTTDSTFVSGPTFLMADPIRLRITMVRDSQGAISGIHFHENGERTRFLDVAHPFQEEEVSFPSGEANLTGTLLVPHGNAPFPGVVLVHGSGAQTRNGFGGLIRCMAEAYARRGIAALIYDKRGTGRSTGDWRNADFATLADDAASGYRFLQKHRDLDPKRIGASGVSQAGWIIALLTARISDVRFVVLQSAAGAGVGVEEQEWRRIQLQMTADGYSPADIERALHLRHMRDAYAKTRIGWDSLASYYAGVEHESWIKYQGTLEEKESPDWAWLRQVFTYDPVPLWQHYSGSLLAIFGTLDTPTPVAQTVAGLEYAMRTGINHDHTIRVFSGATHDFYVGKTGGDHEFPYLKRLVPGYYDFITSWVWSRVGAPPKPSSHTAHPGEIRRL
jgi:dienelactone hydrolase